jgi:DNA polymerase III subunit delta'
VGDPYAGVVGQERAVRHLRAAARSPVHAYLFVGPAGTGARDAARAFAADILCPNGGDGDCDVCRRALSQRHPDVIEVERTGASILVAEIDEVLRIAVRPPMEADRKVIVLNDFHLVDQQYPRLLKTLEEPPASAVFIVLADDVPAELATISSRCVRVDFGPIAVEVVEAALVAEGVEPHHAAEIAAASAGRIDRARLLAADPGFGARQALWRGVPARLDGTGATIAVLTDELVASVETVLDPLRERQSEEVAELEERVARYGERGSGRKDLDTRHKREQRRIRTDELRFGLATLAAVYREALIGESPHGITPQVALDAIAALDAAGEALVRNPNETLLLQGLLSRLTDAAET